MSSPFAYVSVADSDFVSDPVSVSDFNPDSDSRHFHGMAVNLP